MPTRFFIFILFNCIWLHPVVAQDTIFSKPSDSLRIGKYKEQKDAVDLIRSIKGKNKSNNPDTTKKQSKKVFVSIVPAFGYTLQTGFAGILTGSFAFRSGNSGEKLSNIFTSLTYSQYKQFIFPVQANVWTKGNKYNIVLDWRYMHYPSTTYGLNGQTKLSDGYTVDYYYLKFHQTAFKEIKGNLYGGIGYFFDYLWGIKEVWLEPNTYTIFNNYGFHPDEVASGIAMRMLYDSRTNQLNPSNGFYSNLVYRPNFTFLGSQSNWQSILLEFRKYLTLPHRSRNVIAFWSYSWFTAGGKPPYLLLPSTGWDDAFNTGRGYIQGRFRGRSMVYFETEYRYAITRNGLLGGVVFVNGQSFSKAQANRLDVFALGYGLGLRIKLNKLSGTNLALDYGFGANGSRGFFVNINEVF